MRCKLVRCRAGLWLALCVLVAGGCDNRKAKPATTKGDQPDNSVPASSNGAKQAANDVFKQLAEGKVTVAQLTPSFKAHLTKAFTEDVKKTGFSDADVQSFLEQFQNCAFEDVTENKIGNATSFRGRSKKGERDIKSFAMRLVKNGSSYQIDWLHRSERQCAVPETPTDPDLATVYDTTRNFIDTLLGGDHYQTHALMSSQWRKTLAPPHQPDLNKGLDFDRGYLMTQTRQWRNNFVGYGLTKPELVKKDEATVVAQMDAGDKKTPYMVKLSKKESGEWVVDSFKAQ